MHGVFAPGARRAIAAVVLALVGLGTLFALGVPPLGGRDEPVHFLRAFHVSEGHLFADTRPGIERAEACPPTFTTSAEPVLGAPLPRALLNDVSELLADGVFARSLDWYGHIDDPGIADQAPGGRCFADFRSTAVYPPLPYLPAALAIAIGRVLGVSTLVLVLLARLATLAVGAALLGRALHHARGVRAVLAAVALAPVCVFLNAMISADGLSLASSLLALALAWRIDRHHGLLPRRLVTEAAVVVVALALLKPPALLLAVPVLVALARRPERRRLVAATGAVALGLAGAWNLWASGAYLAPTPFPTPGSYAYYDIDSAGQLRHILTAPWSFLAAVARSLGHDGGRIASDAFVQVAGAVPGGGSALPVAAAIVLAALSGARSSTARRWAWAAVAGAYALAAFALAYMGWNALHAPRVDAFQGRYLVVAVVPVAIALARPIWRSDARWLRITVALALLGTNLAVLDAVRRAFYA